MKILAIRIKNLASLESITEIDFTQPPLSTAGIFAITGPTGAGKSTILDALCLALYGKTPRYLQAKEQGIEVKDGKNGSINQGDCRGILRDGTGEGYAEVDFIGIDGIAYTATWRVRRARDKADGAMQSDSQALKNLQTGVPFPEKKTETLKEIERLIGLNFEQFTRSVLLAQGDFTAFLKAAKDDKSSLLEKLTGTHVYSEISRSIFENHKTQEQQLRDLNIKREGIPTLTAEEVTAFKERGHLAKEIINTRHAEIMTLDKEINWHQQFILLGKNVELAINEVKLANNEKEFASNRIAVLEQVESVQPARKLIDQQHDIAGQLVGKNESLATVNKMLSDLKKQQEETVTVLETASANYTESNEKFNFAKPLLIEARKLDVTLHEKQQQLNDATNSSKIIAGNVQNKQQMLGATKRKSEQLVASIATLEKWKTDNQERQPIAEYENLILSKLGDAESILSQSKEYLQQLLDLQKEIEKEDQKLTKLTEAANPLKLKLKTVQETIGEVELKLSLVDITQLETDKASIDNNLLDLSAALAHWDKLFDKITDLNIRTSKLNDARTLNELRVPQLAKANEELRTLKTKRETSFDLVHKAHLALTADVEKLRAQLIEGDPCPVCGSESHPYTTHDHRLNAVMEELQAAHNDNEKAYLEKLSLCSSLQESSSQLAKDITSVSTDIAEKEKSLELLNEKWKIFSVSETIKNIPEQDRINWLTIQVENTASLQKITQEKIKSYNIQKKQQEQSLKQLRIEEQGVQQNTIEINKSTQSRQLIQQQQHNREKENEKLGASLQQIKTNLGSYFTSAEWYEKWQNDPAVFDERVTNFAAKWKDQNKQLIDDSSQLQITQATLLEQESQLQTLLDDHQMKQTQLTGLQQQYDGLMQQRKNIFNGEEVNAVEDAFKETLAKALENLELQKQAEQNLQTDIAKAMAQAEQLQKDIDHLNLQQLTAKQNTNNWINIYNEKHSRSFEIDELLGLLQHSAEWIEEERAALRNIDDAITRAQSVLQERSGRMQQHKQQRLTDRNMEELEILNEQSTEALQQATQQKTETELLLLQDEENKQKIGDLLNDINAQAIITDNWAKLNEIIGSSDGKKFRQIAQEYTLDVLLGYANIHLQSLSQRYLLERIPNTLGLQVLDQDMGNEVRTVFSLSGGESFLVSLALALGLASLSSSRMQVESLFIDEGFGSLDPTTLNIAMDALERLHNQGRKVGVISHVQEMTERIPVQIKVSKENSGRSKVEII